MFCLLYNHHRYSLFINENRHTLCEASCKVDSIGCKFDALIVYI